jgi:hypothetical protein
MIIVRTNITTIGSGKIIIGGAVILVRNHYWFLSLLSNGWDFHRITNMAIYLLFFQGTFLHNFHDMIDSSVLINVTLGRRIKNSISAMIGIVFSVMMSRYSSRSIQKCSSLHDKQWLSIWKTMSISWASTSSTTQRYRMSNVWYAKLLVTIFIPWMTNMVTCTHASKYVCEWWYCKPWHFFVLFFCDFSTSALNYKTKTCEKSTIHQKKKNPNSRKLILKSLKWFFSR